MFQAFESAIQNVLFNNIDILNKGLLFWFCMLK